MACTVTILLGGKCNFDCYRLEYIMTSFVFLHYRIPIFIVCILSLRILYYKFACVSCLCVSVLVCVSMCVSVRAFVRNRLPNHANCSDETFTGHSIGLEYGALLNFISKKHPFKVLLGQKHNQFQE